MSGLFEPSAFLTSSLGPLAVYASALGVALLGGLHCIGMCGGVAALAGQRGILPYQSGRLLGYIVVGALSGLFGKGILSVFSEHPWVQILLTVSIFSLFAIQAYAGWKAPLESSSVLQAQRRLFLSVFSPIAEHGAARKSGFLIGLGTALIPCGWIASFVLIAATSADPVHGALIFSMLWLGSLPALLVAVFGFQGLRLRLKSETHRRAMVIGIFLISVFSFSERIPSAFSFDASNPDSFFCLPSAQYQPTPPSSN